MNIGKEQNVTTLSSLNRPKKVEAPAPVAVEDGAKVEVPVGAAA